MEGEGKREGRMVGEIGEERRNKGAFWHFYFYASSIARRQN
jgi:hypothetical protein